MNYYEVNIEFIELEPWREIVITALADNGAESFVETNSGCHAYVPENLFIDEKSLGIENFRPYIKSISHQLIKEQNWNAKWESNFDPVYVGNELAILAPFHNQGTSHEIKVLIQPQMSFGTGHHQTTWLMAQRLLSLNLVDKSVLDMGTGTGVLAILAEKLGAKYIYAPDIDQWAYENALDNCRLNDGEKIKFALGGAELLLNQSFDILIANINKNILIQQFISYSKVAIKGATLLVSGFFVTDIEALTEEANKAGFIFENKYSKDEWALVEFRKN
jgi:ribosomal protein L11 methyltransferase